MTDNILLTICLTEAAIIILLIAAWWRAVDRYHYAEAVSQVLSRRPPCVYENPIHVQDRLKVAEYRKGKKKP